jgi:hypothetical protein
LDAAGDVLDRAFDPVSEVLLTDYARERGKRTASVLMDALRSRLAAQLGLQRRVPIEQLEDAGIARRLGGRWVLRRAAADALLEPPYDPDSEATLEELRREFGFHSKASVASALRDRLEPRRVVLGRGHRTLVFDRTKARELLAGRWVPGRTIYDVPPAVVRPDETWRTRVGPFDLASATQQDQISIAERRWLLERTAAAIGRRDSGRRVAASEVATVSVASVEGELTERGDFEGLLLLARILDGALSVGEGLSRTGALLAATEKAG